MIAFYAVIIRYIKRTLSNLKNTIVVAELTIDSFLFHLFTKYTSKILMRFIS